MPKIDSRLESDNSLKQTPTSYQQRIEAAFPALCWARAYHWSQGEHTLQEAVDWLQDWADTRGLVGFIGQDGVQAIMAEAWLPYRPELSPEPIGPAVPPPREGLPASTLEAAEQLVRAGDAQAFKDWLMELAPTDRAAVVRHLETKQRPVR